MDPASQIIIALGSGAVLSAIAATAAAVTIPRGRRISRALDVCLTRPTAGPRSAYAGLAGPGVGLPTAPTPAPPTARIPAAPDTIPALVVTSPPGARGVIPAQLTTPVITRPSCSLCMDGQHPLAGQPCVWCGHRGAAS